MSRTARRRSTCFDWEPLEERLTPSLTIQFDYSLDSSGFFAQHPAAQAVLQEAAQILGSQIHDSLAAITPDPATGNTWTATFLNPSGQTESSADNLSIPADTILVYAGGFSPDASFIGFGGPGGYSAQGSNSWINLVGTRGTNKAIGSWGGTVEFSSSANWSFAGTAGAPVANQLDFLSVATHELGHVLGIGTSSGWFADVDPAGNTFNGPHAEASSGGPVPLNTSGENGETANTHWGSSVTSSGQVPTMSVNPFYPGQRREFTPLDWAGLQDIGWHIDHLVVTSEPPAQVAADSGFGLTISAEDPDDQVDPTFNGRVALSLAGGPPGALLGGSLAAAAENGVATFSGLTLNQNGGSYTIQVSGTLMTPATTTSVIVAPVSTTPQLIATAEPPSQVAAGSPFSLTVAFYSPGGQVDPSFEGTITLTLASGPAGATLGGMVTVPAVQGTATFSGLSLNMAGAATLLATAAGATAVTTTPVAVVPGPPTHFVVTSEPPGSVPIREGFNFAVAAEDPYGNIATSFSQSVTAALTSTVGNGFAGGGVTAIAVAGIARFSNFFVGTPGTGYAIRITSGDGQFSVVTTPFNVTSGEPAAGAGGIIRERVLTSGRGKQKHVVGFELDFDSVLDPSRASNGANYTVTQSIRRGRKRVAQPLRFTARYNHDSDAVSLLISGRAAFAQGGRIVVNAAPPSGIRAAAGAPLAGPTVFVILPKARGVRE